MTKNQKPLILIVDDEKEILKTLKDALTDELYRVETLSQGQKALSTIGELIPDLVLLDIFMPNCNGLTLLKEIKKEYPDQKVIIISGFGTIPIAIEAIQKGAIDFVEKPLHLDEILNKIAFLKQESSSVLTSKEPSLVNTSLLRECNIVGESHLFLELIQQVDRLAPHQFPIIMYGEYGTGKTTIANYIHTIGQTYEIFTTVNCDQPIDFSAFPTATIGTIFIKHIDQLDIDSQSTLLSEIKKCKHPHRIIASTKHQLFKLVQKNLFNASLFAYLNRAPIEIPPLRKRPYDIPLLINHYLTHYNQKYKKQILLSTHALRLLRNYKWPGNITELRQVVENIVVHSSEIHQVVPANQIVPIVGEKGLQFVEEQSMLYFNTIDQATNEFKKKFLLYLLKKNLYNIDQVSSRLNISPAHLKNKLLELKIDI
jgi:DNA-binding NtrC family response regulator